MQCVLFSSKDWFSEEVITIELVVCEGASDGFFSSGESTSDRLNCISIYCRLISTADKLFEQGQELEVRGDQEKSYVMFIKYMNLVSIVRKLPEVRRDDSFFSKLLNPKKVRFLFLLYLV